MFYESKFAVLMVWVGMHTLPRCTAPFHLHGLLSCRCTSPDEAVAEEDAVACMTPHALDRRCAAQRCVTVWSGTEPECSESTDELHAGVTGSLPGRGVLRRA